MAFRGASKRPVFLDSRQQSPPARGQLTTLMKQAGVDPGVTDLPWLPRIVRIID